MNKLLRIRFFGLMLGVAVCAMNSSHAMEQLESFDEYQRGLLLTTQDDDEGNQKLSIKSCPLNPSITYPTQSELEKNKQLIVDPVILTDLYIYNSSGLATLPPEIEGLKNLKKLEIQAPIVFLPLEFGNLNNLKELELSNNKLTALPSEFGNLNNLKKLIISYSGLHSLPCEIGKLKSLKSLQIMDTNLNSLPSEIGNLTNLDTLDLRDNALTFLPPEIGKLANLTFLNLRKNNLTSLPYEIGNLANLEYLNLSYNVLSFLPPEIGNLSKLEEICLTNGLFTSLPSTFGNLKELRTLIIGASKLLYLPPELGELKELTALNLYSNKELTTLPYQVFKLENLTYNLKMNGLKGYEAEFDRGVHHKTIISHFYSDVDQKIERATQVYLNLSNIFPKELSLSITYKAIMSSANIPCYFDLLKHYYSGTRDKKRDIYNILNIKNK